MKSLLIMLLIATFGMTSTAQELSSLKLTDFQKEDNRMRITAQPYHLLNGENKLSETLITISFSEDMSSTINLTTLAGMIEAANKKSIESVKNKYTYVPKVVKLSSMKDNTWSLTIEYTAQNDYGATKSGLSSASFNPDGGLIKLSNF